MGQNERPETRGSIRHVPVVVRYSVAISSQYLCNTDNKTLFYVMLVPYCNTSALPAEFRAADIPELVSAATLLVDTAVHQCAYFLILTPYRGFNYCM